MIFNTAENIEYCREFVDGVFSLLIYSHFFPIIASLTLLTLVLLSNSNKIVKRVFSGVVTMFVLWVMSNLSIWLFYDNNHIMMFAWSNIELFATALFAYLLYFIYVLIDEKEVDVKIKMIWILLLLPLVIFSFTKYNLVGVDLSECVAIENKLYIGYAAFVKIIFSVWLVVLLLQTTFRNKDKRKAVLLAGLGALVFFSSFFIMGYVASSTGNYKLEFYGLFGMILFISLLAFAITRYKIMSLKIITTELLVLAIILLISSQFLYLQNTLALLLNTITFLFVSCLGFFLIRSIKKEIEIREIVEQNAILLQQANQNQQSLLHFITHQVKGYMTKTRNIFDGMLAGDYGPITSDKMKEVIKYGFDSETKGVETVQAILRASDLKTGRTEFTKEPTNLSSLVAGVVEKAKGVALNKGLDFNFQIEPNLMANVDALRIGEVFKNLLDNAVIYTRKGAIHIDLVTENGKIKFAVTDTGFGLTPTDKERLFTEGGKGENSMDLNIDSTGYGLFIAKQIVQQHEGRIGARSDGRDKGSEFFVILPKIQ